MKRSCARDNPDDNMVKDRGGGNIATGTAEADAMPAATTAALVARKLDDIDHAKSPLADQGENYLLASQMSFELLLLSVPLRVTDLSDVDRQRLNARAELYYRCAEYDHEKWQKHTFDTIVVRSFSLNVTGHYTRRLLLFLAKEKQLFRVDYMRKLHESYILDKFQYIYPIVRLDTGKEYINFLYPAATRL